MRSLLIALLLCSSAIGQDVIVGPDSIKVGTALTCPRFSTLYPEANNLIVPENITQTLPPAFDFDVIEVSGTLKLSRTYDTAGKFIVIQVLPGGSLDFGSASDPVLRKVDLQIKDSPLLTGTDGNLGPDPEQFGGGILVFGEWKAYGRQLNKTWTTMQPVATGATTLTLTDTVNWQVGDELLIPDTRQIFQRPIPRESKVTIVALNGNTVTLSKPLDFEHPAFTRPDGSVAGLPYVANCTRNIVVQSENPNGVRGHTMFMGNAHVNLYYMSFLDLGRTRPETLDSYNANSAHVGTNQIARYGGPHWHHVHGHYDQDDQTGRLVGCYLNGSDSTKWGVVQHQTADLLVTDNVCDLFVGAGIVTEDGNEVREKNLRNFVAYCRGNQDIYAGFRRFLLGPNELGLNAPGSEGAGFWYHGSGFSTIEDNVSICNEFGIMLGNQNQVGTKIPAQPGDPNNQDYDPSTGYPASMARNVVACSLRSGVEYWQMPIFPNVDLKVFNNNGRYNAAVQSGEGFSNSIYLVNPTIVKQVRANDYEGSGVHSSFAYSTRVKVEGGEIRGHSIGLHSARWVNPQLSVTNTVLQNALNINLEVGSGDNGVALIYTDLNGARFEDLPGLPRRWIEMKESGRIMNPNEPTVTVTDWNGSGKNYHLFFDDQPPQPGAIMLDGVTGGTAVQIGVTPPPTNNPPVVSAVTPTPADVDPATPEVQEYVGPVSYAFTATDPDGDSLTIKVFYSVNGSDRQQYNGPITATGWTFTYSQPVNYVWTVHADDGKGGVTESSLAVQVVARPVEPPPVSDLEQRVQSLEQTRVTDKPLLDFLRSIFKGF